MSYLYISDAKVDMLIDQGYGSDSPATNLASLGGEVGGEVFGVGASAKVEMQFRDRPSNRVQRLASACDALDREQLIGAILDDSRYFRGMFLARWGQWNRFPEGFADVAFFSGWPHDGVCVGLGGSAYHLVGAPDGLRDQQYSNSGIQHLMEFFRERSRMASREWRPPGAWDGEVLDADYDNATLPEPIEFVAERLKDTGDSRARTRVIIGTPLYVAHAPRFGSVEAQRQDERREQAGPTISASYVRPDPVRALLGPSHGYPVPRRVPIGRDVEPRTRPAQEPT